MGMSQKPSAPVWPRPLCVDWLAVKWVKGTVADKRLVTHTPPDQSPARDSARKVSTFFETLHERLAHFLRLCRKG